MSGNGKVGNGRGNNRRHPFGRRNNDASQETSSPDTGASQRSNVSSRSNTQAEEKKFQDRERQGNSKLSDNNQDRQNRGNPSRKIPQAFAFTERPKWVPPKLNIDPLPVPDCPICNKPIRDLLSAISDRNTSAPAHFDCVAAKVAGAEKLDKGDTITYIGGGRFGIINFSNRDVVKSSAEPEQPRAAGAYGFKIKKVIEWESNDERAEWRSDICDHYSVT